MTGSQLAQQTGSIDDAHYTIPLYRKAEAARIIRVPASTLRSWAGGPATSAPLGKDSAALAFSGGQKVRVDTVDTERPPPLITTAEPTTPRGPSVPFVGLAEAFILGAFRSAGVPMQRIRPAISWLQDNIGLGQALASERLKTDGAEVLWDYAAQNDDADLVEGLVVVRNGQQVFRPVVKDYLRCVTYKDGWARMINVGRGKVDVTVDPWMNGGQPTLTRRGIAVSDILSRVRAGESSKAVAADYGLRPAEITALLELAA